MPVGRLLAAILVLAASLFLPPPAGADLEAIVKSGELRVLVVDGAPAFVSLAPDPPPGLEREILDGFARLNHIQVRLVPVARWEDLVPSLLADTGDVIAGEVSVLPERLKKIDFTAEVFPTRDVVVTRAPAPVITSLEALRSVRVGTIRGTGLARRVVELKVPSAKVDDALPATGFHEALRSGRVDAVIDGVEDALLLRKGDPKVQLGMFVGERESIAFGVRKNCPELRDRLSDYVSNVRKSGAWSRLVVKYFGEDAGEVLKQAEGR